MRTAHGHGGSRPKARTDGLLVEHVGDETVVYDLDSKHAHCLAPLAARVFEFSDGERSFEDLRSMVAQRLGQDVAKEEIMSALAQLEDRALLDTPLLVHHGLSRREAIGKVAFAGATAAFGGTLITSIVAPTARAAGSGLPAGCSCTKNKDCLSNHCCGAAGNNDKCNDGCCAEDNSGTSCQCLGTTCATVPTPASCGGGGTVCVPSPSSCDCSLPAGC